MKKIKKSMFDFKSHGLKGSLSKIFGGGGDTPTEGDEKKKPKPKSPPDVPSGPVIIISPK